MKNFTLTQSVNKFVTYIYMVGTSKIIYMHNTSLGLTLCMMEANINL